MYELDDVVYYKEHIVNARYSLCGFNHDNSIHHSGYRHKCYKDIECPKCREIYKWIKDNGIKDYNKFMQDFDRYYNADKYTINNKLYEDIINNKLDLNTGISSYSDNIKGIINKVYINEDDIEILKESNEVVNINMEEGIRYMFKYTKVKFELIHGDKFIKQTQNVFMPQDKRGD